MKKSILLIIALFSIGTYSFAQFDPIADELIPSDMEPCQLNKNNEVKDRFKTKLDTNWREINLTTIAEDDTTRYHSKRIKYKKGADTSRLIYFVHGLGGNRGSWGAVSDAHDQDYIYYDYRVDYAQGWESGARSQRDFKLASKTTQESMIDGTNYFYDVDYSQSPPKPRRHQYDLPYAIGHSQGGLVLRTLDKRYETGLWNTYDSSHRKFWGFVTVGTPNAGASIAVNQEALDDFAGDLASKLASPHVIKALNQINLKIPFYVKGLDRLTQNAGDIVGKMSHYMTDSILQMVTKEKRDPITRQYSPNSTYLTDTLNHSTPDIAKAAFYSIEEDPIFWRITTYMVGKEASEYATYEANEDEAMGKNMEELRLKYLAEAQAKQTDINKLEARIRKCPWVNTWWGYVRCIGNKDRKKQVENFKLEKEAWLEGADALDKANLSYKVIIGGVDPNKMYALDTVGWMCTKIVREVVNRGGPPVTRLVKTRVSSPSKCTGHQVSPIIEKTLIETPTDATVTVPSQMALPGCDIDFIHEMNEVLDHQNPSWDRVIIRSGVNHMQQRNCDQTDAMLRRIYEGYDTPSFFTLERR